MSGAQQVAFARFALLASSATAGANPSAAQQPSASARGLILYVNVSAFGVGALTVALQTDDGSGSWPTLNSNNALVAAAGLFTLAYHPNTIGGYGAGLVMALPPTWRAVITNGATPSTYALAAGYTY